MKQELFQWDSVRGQTEAVEKNPRLLSKTIMSKSRSFPAKIKIKKIYRNFHVMCGPLEEEFSIKIIP